MEMVKVGEYLPHFFGGGIDFEFSVDAVVFTGMLLESGLLSANL